jgi:hypothetical protein
MITKRLKKVIDKVGVEYKEFSEILEISHQKVKSMASGQQKITPEIALLIESKFGVNPSWLIFGTGKMFEGKLDIGYEYKYKLTDDEILFELIEKYGTKEFKKGLKNQLEMIKELKDEK